MYIICFYTAATLVVYEDIVHTWYIKRLETSTEDLGMAWRSTLYGLSLEQMKNQLKPTHVHLEKGYYMVNVNLCMLVGLLIGHVTLTGHLSVMKIREDPTCFSCPESEEMALHFLGSRPATAILCTNLFGAYVMEAQDLCKMCWTPLVRFATASKRIR